MKFLSCCLFSCLIPICHLATADVRKSNNDLCHESGSRYYNQVKEEPDNSNVFPTLEECLASGGKLTEKKKKQLEEEDPEFAEEQEKTEKKDTLETKYAGFNWGAGLMFATTNEAVIKDVSIEDGKISVNNESKNRAIAMLESHYFFVPGKKRIFGHGPFVAVGLGGEGSDPLSTYGAGYMVGFRKTDEASSWNIGLGYFMDSKSQILKKGLNDGDSTTVTDSSKLLRTVDSSGWMLMFSSSF